MLRSVIKRYIHNPLYIPKNVNELVVFGNNSILFTTLSVLNQYNRSSYPKITWIYPTFWLDRVHDDHMGLDWGQTIYGLPREIRNIFIKFRPNYPDTKFIQWHEFQQTRLHAIEELKKNSDFHFYKGEPSAVKDKDLFYEITIKNKNEEEKINVSKESFFYNWYRNPRVGSPLTKSHTMLYELPSKEIPNEFIILGHGLSLVWLLKHFPNKKIINIKNRNDKLPDLPANRDVDTRKAIASGQLKIYINEDIDLRTDEKGQNAAILSHNGKILHEAPIYAATGFAPKHSLFDNQVSESKVINMPLFGINGELISPRDLETLKLSQDIFVAPKNIPGGSLAQSYVHLMDVTKNALWTTEPMFFYKKTRYELLKIEALKSGIELTLNFFDKIDEEISQLDNPLSPESAIELYSNTFSQVCKPNLLEMQIFKKLIRKYFNISSVEPELKNKENNDYEQTTNEHVSNSPKRN